MENTEDQEIFESMILGGLIGSALGALLTKKGDNAGSVMLGAIAGAALLGTLKANERAAKGNVPVLVEEGDSIYEVTSKGRKFIKKVIKSPTQVPGQFKLKA